MTVVEDDPADENYALLQENLERLRGHDRRRRAASWRWCRCRCRAPLVFDGMRLPASYANFYIANGVVIVPTFNDPADRVALGMLAELFPDREVVGIHCVDLVWGLGTLHCMTQQEPLGREGREGMMEQFITLICAIPSASPLSLGSRPARRERQCRPGRPSRCSAAG